MARARILTAIALLAFAGSIVMAQKVTNPEELDKAMKSNGQANQAMRKAVGSDAFADARAQLKIMRQAIAATEGFMALKKKDDGVKFAQNGLAKIDALDKALGATPVDPAAVGTAVKELAGTCQACHMEYRDKDPNGNYIIRPGKID